MEIKVAVDLTPVYAQHRFRGMGFYTKRLFEAMSNILARERLEVRLELVKSLDQLRFISADIVHYPYFSPFFPTIPEKILAEGIVTIHDLIPIKYPQQFAAGIKGRIRWLIQKKKLSKMKAIITDSETWKNQINKLTGFPLEKIFVIRLAAGDEFKKIRSGLKQSVVKKFGLPSRFVLYVGDVNWNKNISTLIVGFSKLSSLDKDLKLILVGKALTDEELPETKDLILLIKKLGLNSRVIRLGWVSTKDLVAIYNLASVYCQPSFDEGFGLPVLEAMACGVPVVSSNAPALKEICQDSALLIDPNSPGKLSQAIKEIIEDSKTRNELITKGINQARKFSWEKTARETINVYQHVYEKNV